MTHQMPVSIARYYPRSAAGLATRNAGLKAAANLVLLAGTAMTLLVFTTQVVPWPLWVILFFIGCQTPTSAVFLLCATQLASVIPGSYLTSTQLFVATWFVANPRVFLSHDFYRSLPRLLCLVVPLLVWTTVTGFALDSYEFPIALTTGLFVAVIALVEFARAKEIPHLLALGLTSACLLAILPYWSHKLGIPFGINESFSGMVQSSEVKRGGVAREGGGMDYNYVGLNIDIAIAGLLYLAFFPVQRKSSNALRIARWGLVVPAVAAIPAVMATLSRAAVLGLALAVITPVAVYLFGVRRKGVISRAGFAVIAVSVVLVAAVVGYQYFAEDIDTYSTAMYDYVEKNPGLEGRTEVFHRALTAVKRNPIIGDLVREEAGLDAARRSGTHNIFLDAVCHAGIPGALLLTVVLFFPIWYFLRRRMPTATAPIMVLFLLVLYASLSLSILRFKVLWATWGILVSQISFKEPATNTPAQRKRVAGRV